MTITRTILLSLLAVGGLASVAAAEGEDGKVEFRIEMVDGKKTIVIKKAIVIEQRVPRPSVIYVVEAFEPSYEWDRISQDFRSHILRSVKKAPF
jgi:hypothetical protein